jgi:hypothetical protein
LLSNWVSFRVVGGKKNARIGTQAFHRPQFPGQIHRIVYPRVQSLPAQGRMDVRRVSRQEDAPDVILRHHATVNAEYARPLYIVKAGELRTSAQDEVLEALQDSGFHSRVFDVGDALVILAGRDTVPGAALGYEAQQAAVKLK